MSVPGATYRVQMHAGFGFDAVAGLADYLGALGITHVYCSPVLQAAAGSTHGYDVVDPSRISADLGGEEAFRRMAAALAGRGIGLVVDIVPNHMATAGRANAWWWDVLEDGPSSRYARFFDIDWDPPEAKLRQRVLVPILGDHYGKVLERGELQLVRRGAEFTVNYFEHELPLSPRTLDEVLADAARRHPEAGGELAELARAFGRLPPAAATEPTMVERRHREKAELRERLALVLDDPVLSAALDESVTAYNSDPDRLDVLLQRQNYRLARWQVAGEELDYRRFFDIPGLVALRVEDPAVFEATHALVAALVGEGLVSGLRVDHPDGLRDPAGYLRRLARACPGTWVVVEKILEGDESLPAGWEVAGTTGYDFLNAVGGLFVDPRGELELTELYRTVTAEDASFAQVARQAKEEVMATSLAADVDRATAVLVEVCEANRRFRDFTRSELRAALREVAASLGVYRTFVPPGGWAGAEDQEHIERALAEAAERRPDLDPDLFGLLGAILVGRDRSPAAAELTQRFQQLTGPVMAKGVEDTAFYRYLRLVALNEVGGDPSRWGRAVDEFHEHNRRVAERWPHTMLSSSTHDTKRSEDVRARLAVLSEVPAEWARATNRWGELIAAHRHEGFSDPATEYLLLQTMVGARPIAAERLQAYMLKAVREAKRATSWTQPNEEYEAGLSKLVEGVTSDPAVADLLDEIVARVAPAGWVNSLAMVALKLTSPGVPDTYQGTESWDLSLVDPDNRRPVDHDGLARRLDALDSAAAGPPPVDGAGAAKLFLVSRLLRLGRSHPELINGDYSPLWATGPRAEHVVAFGRGQRVMTVVPRFTLGLEEAGGWSGTTVNLPEGEWDDCLSGRGRRGVTGMDELLADFPVSVLVRR